MMLIPNNGRLVRNMGSKAQWIAQAREVVIPQASQLILFIRSRMRSKNTKKQHRCKIKIEAFC